MDIIARSNHPVVILHYFLACPRNQMLVDDIVKRNKR